MRNDIGTSRANADWENAKTMASVILREYKVNSRFYLTEQNIYVELLEHIASALITAYDNGFEAGKAKA